MTINERSLLIRYAYMMSDYTPTKTNLCSLFWRCVLLQPLKILGILFVVFCLGFVTFYVPISNLGWKGIFVAPLMMAAFWLLAEVIPNAFQSLPMVELGEFIKGNYCPTIEIKGEE